MVFATPWKPAIAATEKVTALGSCPSQGRHDNLRRVHNCAVKDRVGRSMRHSCHHARRNSAFRGNASLKAETRRERPRRRRAAKQRDEGASLYIEHGGTSLPDALLAPADGPSARFATRSLPQTSRQVLEANLNCSESRRERPAPLVLPTKRAARRPR
jgi:hypothetical protein